MQIIVKARSLELVEKSIAAMIAAIEVYNKPNFQYREETFSILAINAWELLLKAKWLKDNGNQIRSLYVTEKRLRPNGQLYKHAKVKMTGSGNPFTHSLEYLRYHGLREPLKSDRRYCHVKKLDPDNPRSAKQEWFSRAIFNVLDKHYTLKS